jgi:hypothetical protein
MFLGIAFTVLLASHIAFSVATDHVEDVPDQRQEKHFSLFSVVTFKNDECTSESTLAGGVRTGTCYTTTECSDKSGTKSGNCASGFGVCCLFINSAQSSTATISQNRTLLRNSAYPSYATETTALSIKYTINKMQSDICQIRLAFNSFIIAGPANTNELIVSGTRAHNCLNDQLTIVPTSHTSIWPTLCGTLTGEHLYIELSPTATDSVAVTILTGQTTANSPTYSVAQRTWDIQADQIPCYASYRAPPGCHRYLTTMVGKITSLNFYKNTGGGFAANSQNSGLELADQALNTCIRRYKGMSCVEYSVCVADTQGIALIDTTTGCPAVNEGCGTINEGFSIETTHLDGGFFVIDATHANTALFDVFCTEDYIEIPSSSAGACGGTIGLHDMINTRYCGQRLGASLPSVLVTYTNSAICDCSEPFVVRHGSDIFGDDGGETLGVIANRGVRGRGFCLDFVQKPAAY